MIFLDGSRVHCTTYGMCCYLKLAEDDIFDFYCKLTNASTTKIFKYRIIFSPTVCKS